MPISRFLLRSAVLAIAGAAVPAAPAVAANVAVRPAPGAAGNHEVVFVAAPGERNDVLVSYDPDAHGITVADPGATLHARAGCAATDAHTVHCGAPDATLSTARLRLANMDDAARTQGNGTLIADGGPGSDRLTGGAGNDRLGGGGGRDVLSAGAGDDVLTDDDVTPDADELDGGPGSDTVSYARRISAVRVDLAARRGGEAGERDTLRAVEQVTGGSGDDDLAGDGSANVLDGGPGRNRLAGRGGDDQLRNGSGGSVSCGAGVDTLFGVHAADLVPRDCEIVTAGGGARLTRFVANPVAVGAKALRSRFTCPASAQCSGTLQVQEAAGARRLIAQGAIPPAAGARTVRAPLTKLGRRLLKRRGGVLVRVVYRGTGLAAASWTQRIAR